MSKSKTEPIKIITKNRKVRQKFFILESFEAGLALWGHEVKSLRQGKISIEESLVRIEKGELFLFNAHIPPYPYLSHTPYEPTRTRKLLMHRKEIDRLAGEVQTQGLTLVPLELYFKHGLAKVSVGLAKGKKTEDRREEIKKRDIERDVRRQYGKKI
jgi:SsrA-binding protein